MRRVADRPHVDVRVRLLSAAVEHGHLARVALEDRRRRIRSSSSEVEATVDHVVASTKEDDIPSLRLVGRFPEVTRRRLAAVRPRAAGCREERSTSERRRRHRPRADRAHGGTGIHPSIEAGIQAGIQAAIARTVRSVDLRVRYASVTPHVDASVWHSNWVRAGQHEAEKGLSHAPGYQPPARRSQDSPTPTPTQVFAQARRHGGTAFGSRRTPCLCASVRNCDSAFGVRSSASFGGMNRFALGMLLLAGCDCGSSHTLDASSFVDAPFSRMCAAGERPHEFVTDPGPPRSQCSSDEECTDGDQGRCSRTTSHGFSCTYDECDADEDCGEGHLCGCGVGWMGQDRCLPDRCSGECGDVDCAPTWGCNGPNGAYLVDSAQAFACHTAHDECRADTDCPRDEFCTRGPLTRDALLDHWECHPVSCGG